MSAETLFEQRPPPNPKGGHAPRLRNCTTCGNRSGDVSAPACAVGQGSPTINTWARAATGQEQPRLGNIGHHHTGCPGWREQ